MSDNPESRVVEIMKRCPRFARCSVPICPIDLLQKHRTRLPGEPKCTLGRSARLRVGRNANLPLQGLTKREWAAKQRWNALSDSEKLRRNAHLRQISPICPCFSDREGKIGVKIPLDEKSTDKQAEIQS